MIWDAHLVIAFVRSEHAKATCARSPRRLRHILAVGVEPVVAAIAAAVSWYDGPLAAGWFGCVMPVGRIGVVPASATKPPIAHPNTIGFLASDKIAVLVECFLCDVFIIGIAEFP